ncbi:MAG: hypothetical protein SOI23_03930 [Atopobiaceae bacterium]|jgi:putative aminopeptidase FrvX|nr:M42 family peptidase [Atopobium sp.]
MDFDDGEVVKLLGRLSNAKAPSGFEDETIGVVRDFCAGWAQVEENSLRDGFIVPSNFSGKKPVLMFDAHGDEVGCMVKAIRQNGTMSFVELGRFAAGTLAGQDVYVHATDGRWVHGVVGVKPPHFMSAAEKDAGTAPELILDVGATSRADALERFCMGIGEPVVSATEFSFDGRTGIAVGKAFDCRAGVCALLLALRELSSRADLAFDVVASISGQEEVGERGVAAAARRFSPMLAYMFEGCPADDTFVQGDEVQTALRQGPMLRYFDRCMITNPRYQRFVLAVARKLHLPHQVSVRSGGGTDGGPVHLMDIPCVVAGVPCRYIHAGTAICALEDVESSASLAVGVASALTEEIAHGF